MRLTVKPKIKVIESESGKEFEQAFNSTIEKLGYTKDYNIEISNGKFFAIIHYNEENYEPETIAEEYELRGEIFHCRDCPELQDDHDARKKRFACKRAEYGITRKDESSCEWFYRQLSQGKLKPIEFPLR